MWTVLLLALWQSHTSVALLFHTEVLSQYETFNYTVNLTQFMGASYIWTTVIGTTDWHRQSSFTCIVDHTVCATLTNVAFIRNLTYEGKRYSDEISGVFLGPDRRPTSMLFLDPDSQVGLILDILVYTSLKNTCGVFYSIYFNSSSLRKKMNESVTWPQQKNVQDIRSDLDKDHVCSCPKWWNQTPSAGYRRRVCEAGCHGF